MTIKLEPWQIDAYKRWEAGTRHDLPGRYSTGFESMSVFQIHQDDQPVSCLHYKPDNRDQHSSSRFPEIDGISQKSIERILSIFDGTNSLLAAGKYLSGIISQEKLEDLCQQLLGKWLYLPEVLRGLEHHIRLAEIVRFPMQSPYLVLREYWSNSGDVRSAVPGLFDNLGTLSAFKDALADLHILATMGKDMKTYYGGSGGVPTIPGHYRSDPVRTGLSTAKACFIDDYLKQIGLAGYTRDDQLVLSEANLLLGYIDGQGKVFHHPPSEGGFLDKILNATRETLLRVAELQKEPDNKDLLLTLSRLHKLFLHAHPFYNINNSVIMNIVNYCLIKTGYGVIPHLLLDFIALRTGFDDYACVFRKAVADFSLPTAGNAVDDNAMSRIRDYHALLQKEVGRNPGT